MMRRAAVCLLAWMAAACGGGGGGGFPVSAAHPLLGHAIPEVKARQLLDGNALVATALQGKPVVIKFFADYCEPCKRTLPATESLHRKYPDVFFLGVSEDESRQLAQKVVNTFSLSFPVIHDGSNVYSGRFRVTEMPTTFVIDRTGVVRWIGGAGQTDEDLAQAVEAVR